MKNKPIYDGSVRCCRCTRQKEIDGSAWIYCKILNEEMMALPDFDETGELHGCTHYKRETVRPNSRICDISYGDCPVCQSPLEDNGVCSDVGNNNCQYLKSI